MCFEGYIGSCDGVAFFQGYLRLSRSCAFVYFGLDRMRGVQSKWAVRIESGR